MQEALCFEQYAQTPDYKKKQIAFGFLEGRTLRRSFATETKVHDPACKVDWSLVEESCHLTYFYDFEANPYVKSKIGDTVLMQYLKRCEWSDRSAIAMLLQFHDDLQYSNRLGFSTLAIALGNPNVVIADILFLVEQAGTADLFKFGLSNPPTKKPVCLLAVMAEHRQVSIEECEQILALDVPDKLMLPYTEAQQEATIETLVKTKQFDLVDALSSKNYSIGPSHLQKAISRYCFEGFEYCLRKLDGTVSGTCYKNVRFS